MAYCVLSGKLLDMVGKPLARATFKFTSSSNSTSIINTVDTVITTDSNGLYYSNLAYGTYTISFRGATDTNYKIIAKNAVIGVLGPITIERLIGHDTEALPSALQDLWTESQANDRGLWTGLGVTRFFEDGFTITNTDQVAANLRTGKLYRWSGTTPKAVPKGFDPASDSKFIALSGINIPFKLSKVVTELQGYYGLSNFVTIKDYGARGNNLAQTLQTWVNEGLFSGLPAIQAAYPRAASLEQSIDWLATQTALDSGRTVHVPDGVYWISDELEFVTVGQELVFHSSGGYGYGSFSTMRSTWVKKTCFIAYGSRFELDSRVRTRVNYRGSAADPQDAPLSVVFNIQAEGVILRNPHIWLNCDYNDLRPNNFGDPCDIGIFVGCRVGVQIINPQIIGYFRKSGLHYDVTHDTELPRHLDKKGVPYPMGQNVGGADGCFLINPFILGGRRGLAIEGSRPAPGYDWYGPAYYDEQLKTIVPDSRGNFGFSDFYVEVGRIFGPEHHSMQRLKNPVGYGGELTEATMMAEPTDAPAAVYISGLAGNANHTIHGIRFLGTRISSFEAFRVRLDYAARPMFIGCHIEGSGVVCKDTAGAEITVVNHWYGHIAGSAHSKRLQIYGGVTTTGYSSAFNWYFGQDFTWHNERGDAYVRSLNGVQDYIDIFLSRDRTRVARFTQSSLTLPTGISIISTAEDLDLRGEAGYGVRLRSGADTLALFTPNSGLTFYGTAGTIEAGAAELDLRGGEGFGVRLRDGSTTIGRVTTEGMLSYGTNYIVAPDGDNTVPVCRASHRASTIYLGTSPQVTSDANAKLEIGAIPPEVLAAWADVEWVRYKLKDGSSNRWHTGLIAQQVIAAFAAHSLDAREYGVVCWEEWEEEAVLAEDGVTVVTPAKTTGAWSVRYDEAYAIESAYQRSK